MLGICLLLLNNHKKFVDTVKNIIYTTKDVSNAREKNNKYFHDRYGRNYDIKTGHLAINGNDKYTGHRGIIDANTGRAIEDYIERQISLRTDNYVKNKFAKIKNRLDSRKECLLEKREYYFANGIKYDIYYDDEVKNTIDVCQDNLSFNKYKARDFIDKGYSQEEIYEYYCWKGEKIKYPLDVAKEFNKYIKY